MTDQTAAEMSSNSNESTFREQYSAETWHSPNPREQIIMDVAERAQLIGDLNPEYNDSSQNENESLKIIDMPTFKQLSKVGDSFAAMQEWEGVVEEIDDDVFRASLIDITGDGEELDEFAEILVGDLQESDRSKLHVGAIFRWVIGYHRSASGTKTRGSRIHFRKPVHFGSDLVLPNLEFEEVQKD